MKEHTPANGSPELDEVLTAFCETMFRIYERLEREQPEVIDELMRNRRMETKVDSSKQNS